MGLFLRCYILCVVIYSRQNLTVTKVVTNLLMNKTEPFPNELMKNSPIKKS